jgi:hypothetical protein
MLQVICRNPKGHDEQGSIDGIATGYGLDGPRIESLWGRDFPAPSKPVLGSAHPLV